MIKAQELIPEVLLVKKEAVRFVFVCSECKNKRNDSLKFHHALLI